MKWSIDDWIGVAADLSALYSLDHDVASKQLSNHRHFIEVKDREFGFVSAHRVVHGLMGHDLLEGARSGQDIKRITKELENFGFTQIDETHPQFEANWQRYVRQCNKAGSAQPSGGEKLRPKDRSFFLISEKLAKSFEDRGAVSPRNAAFLGGDFEGAVTQVTTNRHERSSKNRRLCIDHFRQKNCGRLICESCKIDFGVIYGKIGAGFMHIHHKDPLGDSQEARLVDPTKDLVPLCPNCHAMAHRKIAKGHKPRSPKTLREIRKEQRDKT